MVFGVNSACPVAIELLLMSTHTLLRVLMLRKGLNTLRRTMAATPLKQLVLYLTWDLHPVASAFFMINLS